MDLPAAEQTEAFAEILREIQAEIALAQERSVYAAPRVQLLAVSKTVDCCRAAACWQAGQALGLAGLAENKVQELAPKCAQLPPEVCWHFIGHLQTNKVKQVLGRAALLHALDSWRLALELERRAAALDITAKCLVEVNVAAEASKFGLAPAEVWDFLREVTTLPHVRICGLMTVAPAAENPEEARPIFAELRRMRDMMRQRVEKVAYSNLDLQELSMGMSNDYKVAVEEGATIVRLGSVIFGDRIYR